MDFLKLNNHEFEEYLFDMHELKTAFEAKQEKLTFNINSEKPNLGIYNFETTRKGNIYLTHSESNFDKNLIVKSKKSINCISLFFMNKGDACCHVHNKKEIVIPSFSHNTFFMNEEYKEEAIYLKGKVQECVSLHLSIPYFEQLVNSYPELFEESFLRYQQGESFYLNTNYQQNTIEEYTIIKQIENSHLMGNSNKAYVDAKILELLTQTFSRPIEKETIFKDYNKIQEAAHILISDIHNPPSIRTLALKVGINEKKLKQGFKTVFNTTVYGYLFEHKMQLAKQYLQDTQKPISEIALLCGYEHPSHFCTAFKRQFGVSPRKLKIQY